MTIRVAIATILGCALLLAGIEGGIGYGLGRFVPGYYRGVFGITRPGPWFDPPSVGFGLGVTQGLAGGAAVGLAVVALFLWRETRLGCPEGPAADSARARGWWRWIVAALVAALLFVAGLGVGGVVGLLVEEIGAHHRRYLEERDALAPLIVGDPGFAGVQITEDSAGGAWLNGEVPGLADLERLRGLVGRAIGEPRAKVIMGGVEVRR